MPKVLPKPWDHIWLTYKKEVGYGPYRDSKRIETVTKRAFYSDLFNNYAIPPDWQYFTIGGQRCLLPHGWGGDTINIDKAIGWEYCNDKI